MEYSTITYEVSDQVALITLNRPESMNAWNATMHAEIGDALGHANNDDEVRAIVITGAGRAFCAGADLQGGSNTFSGLGNTDSTDDDNKTVLPYQINKPVIAAINGAAVGVGLTYPMLCDIRIVAEDAKLGFVFTRRGMIPEFSAHLLVQRVAGLSNAADLLMSGRIFLGKEAAELGIASMALPKKDVLTAALEKARDYVNAAPVSVAISKKLIWEGLHTSMSEMAGREDPLFEWVGSQPDSNEGVLSFIEKRPPQWQMSTTKNLPDTL